MPENTIVYRHQCRMAVRWGDMDAYGHVNNTVFFRYLESARFAYIEEVCMAHLDAMPMVVLADIRCHFQAQLHYPADVVVKSAVTRLGNSSFDLHAQIWQDDRLCATSQAVMVWFDAQSGRPARIPEAVAQAIREYENI